MQTICWLNSTFSREQSWEILNVNNRRKASIPGPVDLVTKGVVPSPFY